MPKKTPKPTNPLNDPQNPWCVCGYRQTEHRGDTRRCPHADGMINQAGNTVYKNQTNGGSFSESAGFNQ